jgi:hypothetical protein
MVPIIYLNSDQENKTPELEAALVHFDISLAYYKVKLLKIRRQQLKLLCLILFRSLFLCFLFWITSFYLRQYYAWKNLVL